MHFIFELGSSVLASPKTRTDRRTLLSILEREWTFPTEW